MKPDQVIKQWYEEQDVKSLAKYLFPSSLCAQNMTPTQEEIIRDVVFDRIQFLDICAMTQYGKTETMAIAYCLKILFSKDLKIVVIASQDDKTEPIRNFIISCIYDCPFLLNLADIDKSGKERMKTEASKKRVTFSKNGCELRYYSAQGGAQRLMGHGLTKGTGIVHAEEAAEFERKAFAKVWRFLTGKLEGSMFIQTYNPWDRDTVAFDNSIDPMFKHYHIGYPTAIKEGRITEEDIELQKRKITPLEFQVLFESRFPDEAEDQLIPLSAIERSFNNDFKFDKDLEFLESVVMNSSNYTEAEVRKTKKAMENFSRFISCDPADQGLDWTVISWGVRKGTQLKYFDFVAMPKSEGEQVVGEIIHLVKGFIGKVVPGEILIDAVGIGSRDLQALRSELRGMDFKNLKTTACRNGEQAIKKEEFRNKKAENYFGLRAKMVEGFIDLPSGIQKDKIQKIKAELVSIKFQRTRSDTTEIVPPDKSPDWADSIMYAQWRGAPKLAFAVA